MLPTNIVVRHDGVVYPGYDVLFKLGEANSQLKGSAERGMALFSPAGGEERHPQPSIRHGERRIQRHRLFEHPGPGPLTISQPRRAHGFGVLAERVEGGGGYPRQGGSRAEGLERLADPLP